MVSDVTLTSAVANQQQTIQAEAEFSEDYLEFLNLLTVQLQNQDPLDPLDTNQMTDQLVQFSQVEQQINGNQKLDDLVALELGNGFSNAQNYVGLEVSYVSAELPFDGTNPTTITYALDGEAAISKINILDESGNVIYSEDALKSLGAHEFTWGGQLTNGGTAAPGTYSVSVEAQDLEGTPVGSTTVVRGTVRGVESQNGQIFLLVGERAVAVSSVLNTNNPNANALSDGVLTSALNYIGMNVTYPDTILDFNNSQPVDVGYNVTANAERGQFLVFNDSGEVIYSEALETDIIGYETEQVFNEETGLTVETQGDPIIGIESGSYNITWDGSLNDNTIAPAGTYHFAFDLIGASGNRVPVNTYAEGLVTGIETIGGEIYLSTENGAVALSNVTSISVPEETTQPPTEEST